jgi:hypothetical protein
MKFSRTTAASVAVSLAFTATAAMAEAPPRVEMKVIPSRSASRPGGANMGSSPVTPRNRPRPDAPGGGGSARPGGGGSAWTDAALQSSFPNPFAPALLTSSEGIGADGVAPPDTNVAAGDTQVVEIVNMEYAVFDKTGVQLTAPLPIHTIFTGLGGMCEAQDGGDPIVLFDQQAHRWFISQLEYNSNFSSNLFCTAVSQTADAINGGWYLYEWNFGSDLPDYPKVGVWPDAYYFSANLFWRGSFFLAADACALDRNAMINFQDATGVCFSSSSPSLLPASADGATPPPAGAPGLYIRTSGSSALALYRFHVDFVNTGNSTFTGVSVPVAAFHLACGSGGTCVPQPATSQQLDSLGDRLMYRLSYRNFGTYQSLLVNQSVQVRSTSNQVGVRWYEIRNPFGTPAVYQQSTFAPDTTQYRWMGSMAQDKQGNLLVGYSSSSSSQFPSIAYSGRLTGEPLNQLESESVSLFGTGSQTLNRWGDYSSMSVDPVDDCTFWYANEYLVTNGNSWHTRVESLKFPGCN